MARITGRTPPVAVEYDAKRGGRKVKFFLDAYAARRFYTKKHSEGLEPEVHKTLWLATSPPEMLAVKQVSDDGEQVLCFDKNGDLICAPPSVLFSSQEAAVAAYEIRKQGGAR